MLTENTKLIKKSAILLWEIYSRNIDKYIDLFFYENAVELENSTADILERTGIILQDKDKWIANVMIFPFRNKLITTDFLFSIYRRHSNNNIFVRNFDDVWPMYPFETLSFIESIKVDLANQKLRKKQTLDLASGSGAISLFLADKFENVISADINPKAIKYARFNSILNNQEDKITNIQSDVFENLYGYKFDYIVWNGPTGAFPEVEEPNKYYPQYVYGGVDGTKFTKRFLNNFTKYTNKKFKIKFLDCSLGTNQESLTESYIKNSFSELFAFDIKIEFLNKNGKQSLKNYQKLYGKYCLDKPMNLESDKSYKESTKRWEEFIKNKKLNYVYFSYISISPSDKFKIKHTYPQNSSFLPRHNFGFEWHFASRKFIKNYLKTKTHN